MGSICRSVVVGVGYFGFCVVDGESSSSAGRGGGHYVCTREKLTSLEFVVWSPRANSAILHSSLHSLPAWLAFRLPPSQNSLFSG